MSYIFTMNVDEAERRLLPRDFFRNRDPWRKPANDLPIDIEINNHIHSKLIDREKLGSDFDPFLYARKGIFFAIKRAKELASLTPAEIERQRADIEVMLRESAKLYRALTRFSKYWKELGINRGPQVWGKLKPGHIREFALDPAGAVISDLLENVDRMPSQLESFQSYLKVRRNEVVNNQPDPDKHAFVAGLAVTWVGLMKAAPKQGGRFLGFVSASWDSLLENSPAVSWDRAVRHAVKLNEGLWDNISTGSADRGPETWYNQGVFVSTGWLENRR